ncbi:Auxin-responsive protein [Melia azedarach]|uniref:Auxin-responsive protein n=1 Tax=Melia azedarach TaxID=155640 RepID=A0ACC1XXP4_MELAZ|nr:Auxin-responsive protein [Melia azedarach]
MISTKKLMIKLQARKWQKRAAMRRISSPKTSKKMDASPVAEKGHFVIYTFDQRRFVIPLAYLSNCIFQELFKLSEEVFGLSSDGPITLPCDADFMDYIVLLIHGGLDKGLEKALPDSITTNHCSLSASFHHEHRGQHSVVCGY